MDEGPQGVGAGFRGSERGDPGASQEAERFRRFRHDKGADRGGRARALGDRHDRELRLEARRRSDDGKDSGELGRIGHRLDRASHHVGARTGKGQIDYRAAARTYAAGCQAGTGLGCRRRHVEAKHPHPIDRHCGAAAGGRDHADAGALAGLRPAPDRERRHLEQGLEVVDADDAQAFEEGVDGRVRGETGARVRHRNVNSGPRAAQLVGDHRLAGGERGAREPSEAVAVADGLEKQEKGARSGIVDARRPQLAHADVGLVADRDQLREPETANRAPAQQRAEKASALRDDHQGARGKGGALERRVGRQRERRPGIDDAEAAWPDDAHPRRPRGFHQASLAPDAGAAGLGEAARKDAGDGNAGRTACRDRLDHRSRGDEDVGMVDRPRHRREIGIGDLAHDAPAFRVDGVDRSPKAVPAHVSERASANLGGVVRGPDQRHAAGTEQGPDEGRIARTVSPVRSHAAAFAKSASRTRPRRSGSSSSRSSPRRSSSRGSGAGSIRRDSAR